MALETLLLRYRILVSIVLLLAIWQSVVLSSVVPETYLPGLPAIGSALWAMIVGGELVANNGLTLLRAIAGLAAASILGIALALLSDFSPSFRSGLRPLAALIQPIPPAVLVPMAIFFLGLGLKLHAFIVILVTVWPPFLNGSSALAAVPDIQIRTARMLGMGRLDILFHVKLPAAMPEIMAGIRQAAAISLVAVVVAEMLAGQNGLGHMLVRKSFANRLADVYALMFVGAANGLVINALVDILRNRLTGWHARMRGAVR